MGGLAAVGFAYFQLTPRPTDRRAAPDAGRKQAAYPVRTNPGGKAGFRLCCPLSVVRCPLFSAALSWNGPRTTDYGQSHASNPPLIFRQRRVEPLVARRISRHVMRWASMPSITASALPSDSVASLFIVEFIYSLSRTDDRSFESATHCRRSRPKTNTSRPGRSSRELSAPVRPRARTSCRSGRCNTLCRRR
jgi:hypothetical protein